MNVFPLTNLYDMTIKVIHVNMCNNVIVNVIYFCQFAQILFRDRIDKKNSFIIIKLVQIYV